MKTATMKFAAACAAVALLLAACGGGGGGSGDSGSSAQLVGTAATGAALANAPVTITDSTGASPCVEASITTSSVGGYTCTLKAGETAPFFIVVTDPTGNSPALVSVTTTTPAAGATLTLNATPLTTAIVAQLSADGNALSVVSGRTVDAAALQAVTSNVVAQLAQVLDAIGVPAGYDPFTTSITAATADKAGNTADLVLDVVKVVTDPASGKLALTTISDPTPVVMATAASSGGNVAPPTASVSTLSQGTQLMAQKLAGCFAVPSAQRVLTVNTAIAQSDGGPEVDEAAAACDGFVSDSDNAAAINFLHNGYSAGQFFYGMLTSASMDNAVFSVPEVLAYYPKSANATAGAPDAYDRAVLNVRYVDGQGDPGSVITVAALIPGSSSAARPTEWWLVGNQQAVDVGVRMNLRRLEQFSATAPASKGSTFQNGVLFSINAKGPGSVRAGALMQIARVTGPGLPTGGLVYKRSSGAQDTMDLFDKNGNLAASVQCGNVVPANCPNLWFSKTAGITGTAATTLATNPNLLIWAQPSDGFDVSKFVKGARYKVDLFYGANTTTPDVTVFKTLLTDLVPATNAVNLPWNTPGAQTLAALDPAGGLAGAQTALPVDWVQNLAAPQIGGIAVNVNLQGSFGANKQVRPGATSALYDVGTVPAFTSTTLRSVLLGYRSGDTSNRSAVYNYN
jgi:hypothetical protein